MHRCKEWMYISYSTFSIYISSFTIMLETWPAPFFRRGKEGHATHFMQIENWHKQQRSSKRSAEINFLNQSIWGKTHLCKMVAHFISFLCCSEVSSCNFIPLCSCTTQHAESPPRTSRHGRLIVVWLGGTSSNIKYFRWVGMPRRNNEFAWQTSLSETTVIIVPFIIKGLSSLCAK